jgi:hypothetical protein
VLLFLAHFAEAVTIKRGALLHSRTCLSYYANSCFPYALPWE